MVILRYNLGMPFPQNLETAQQVESIIRGQGATPATVAILQGRIHIGTESLSRFFLKKI